MDVTIIHVPDSQNSPSLHFCFHQDNTDRELKEAARQRRLKELEEKRFAWSSGDQTGGFGRSSSENDVEMLTKEGLLEFFQRSQSPHCPLERSASARRHRHTMTSIADRELQGYLELFGSTGNTSDFSKFNSLPRLGRPIQRRMAPWMLGQDNNRELGRERKATSPHSETEPIVSHAKFSSSELNDNGDNNNNNNYSSVSESSALPRPFCVFQKPAHIPNPAITGHMSVSVEKHTLVRGPQAFDLISPNNNSNHMHFVNRGDVVVTDLEIGRQSPPKNLDNLSHDTFLERGGNLKVVWEDTIVPPTQAGVSPQREKDEEDYSTVSSTTCDTPLPLDTSVSNKKPMFYIMDCTETDISVTLDCSEVESSSTKEGLHFQTADCIKDQESRQDPQSTSPNDQSASTNELSAPKSVDAASMAPSTTTEEWDTESCDTAEGKQTAGKDAQRSSRKPAPTKSKGSKATKTSAGHGVRTLANNDNQGMRKVIPITKLTRTGSNRRAEKPAVHDSGETRRPPRDQSTPARGRSEKTTRPPRHSSLPPDESKAQKGGALTGSVSRWARDSMPRKASIHKPSAKPVRNIPKPAPEEKMCRSTMRALAQAQAQAQAQTSPENSSSHTHSAKNTSGVPSFARNTVASSSRTRKELGPPSVPSTPSRSPSLLGRQKPTRASHAGHTSDERPQATSLRRVQSVKATSCSTYRSETPPPPVARENVRKSSSFSEKSVQPRDLMTSSRSRKPSWK